MNGIPHIGVSFGIALEALKAGRRLQRTGWNGKGLWLELQRPDANSKMTLPYVYLNYPADAANTPGARVPWAPSQTDLLAEDWILLQTPASPPGPGMPSEVPIQHGSV